MEKAADPVLEVFFPGFRERSDVPARAELLEATPERVKTLIRDVALVSSDQALALVKSHYPRVDLQRVGEGFAADAGDEEIESLMVEARAISSIIVDDIDLDLPAQ